MSFGSLASFLSPGICPLYPRGIPSSYYSYLKTMSWSAFANGGSGLNLSMSDGWDVKARSRVLFPLVWKSTACSIASSSCRSRNLAFSLVVLLFPVICLLGHSMCGRLKSPPKYKDGVGVVSSHFCDVIDESRRMCHLSCLVAGMWLRLPSSYRGVGQF